jgi:glycosyltransferase involved in cell wall biosynthesis
MKKKRIVFFANTDWYLYNFRLPLIKDLDKNKYEIFLLSPPGPYGQKLLDLGFRWSPINLDRASLNIFKEIKTILWLRNFIKKNRIDLVHGFTIKCAVYTSIASINTNILNVFAITGMGYIFTSNDRKARLLKPAVWVILKLTLNRKLSQLILQNPDDLNLFVSSKLVSEQKISLILSSGVDCQKFIPNTNNNYRDKLKFRVLLSARLLWDKGIGTYIESAKGLLKEDHNIEFLIAGTGDPGNPSAIPMEKINEWSNHGYIKYLGHVDDMPSLLQSVDLAVLPSAREGLPKSLIEALACGIPIVSSDVPGCREVVEDNSNGLLIPYGDEKRLQEAVKFFLAHPELHAQFSKNARLSALNRFDAKIINHQTKKVYKDLFTKLN